MKHILQILTVALLAIGSAAFGNVDAQERIGAISRVQATAAALREGLTRPLARGAPVYLSDVITTGPGARLSIAFVDGTSVTLGESAELRIDEFVYNDASERARFGAHIKGAFRFVTGKLKNALDASVLVTTPVAIIGVRGTDFLAGTVDGVYGVLLFDGSVTVTTQAGSTVLDRPGLGTNISGPGAAPSQPTVWPSGKVEQAMQLIGFR